MDKEIHRPAIDVFCRTGVITWFDVCFKSFPESVPNLSPASCHHRKQKGLYPASQLVAHPEGVAFNGLPETYGRPL
jgi:hypothetical protein